MKRRQILVGAGLCTFGLGAVAARSHVGLKLTVPSRPGSAWDQTARSLAAAMQGAGIAREVSLENRGTSPGLAGLGQFAVVARGDPQALLLGAAPMLSQLVFGRAALLGVLISPPPPIQGASAERLAALASQLTPLARLTSEPLVVAVAASSRAQSLKDLGDVLKEQGRELREGRAGLGGGERGGCEHALALQLETALGVDAGRMPYRAGVSGGDASELLQSGAITAVIAGYSELAEQFQNAKLRPLAIGTAARKHGIASFREQGVDLEAGNWRGVFAGAGLSAAQRDGLIENIKLALDHPHWRATVQRVGWHAAPLFGEEFRRFVDADAGRYERAFATLTPAARKLNF